MADKKKLTDKDKETIAMKNAAIDYLTTQKKAAAKKKRSKRLQQSKASTKLFGLKDSLFSNKYLK